MPLQMSLSHSQKQLILYAKNHFVRGDVVTDLTTITSKAYAIAPTYVESRTIFNFVFETFWKLVEYGYMKSTPKDLMISLFHESKYEVGLRDILNFCLSKIAIADAENLDLGKPDRTYLTPKRASTKEKI